MEEGFSQVREMVSAILSDFGGAALLIVGAILSVLWLLNPLVRGLRTRLKIRSASKVTISIQNSDGSLSSAEISKKNISPEEMLRLIEMVKKSDE
ncbi:hypothetical protein [Yoonia sp. R2-816]|uniref:hypothetical protein n=1 Tax=Yoonia sp. R2-816 TaxID=3342638 RepID=UPI00372BDD69